MKTIDACGLSCPQPVILAKNALASGNAIITVDNSTAAENVRRFAENAGFKVTQTQNGDEFALECVK